MSSLYFQTLDRDAGRRYQEKLTVKGEILPDPMDEAVRKNVFSNDVKKLPNLSFGDLFMYLVVSKNAYTPECLKNYKSLEAYNFLLSGKVFDLKLYRNDLLQVCVVTCSVQASQTLGKFHLPWAAIECNGSILSAHCSCEAGLGETCSHVAALLFTIEAAIKEGVTDPACTSLPCTWKKSAKKVEIIPAVDINFSHKNRGTKSKEKEIDMALPSEEAYQKFFTFIKDSHPDAPVLTLFTDSEDTESASSDVEMDSPLPPNIIDIVKKLYPSSTPLTEKQKVEVVMKQLESIRVDCDSIEEETRDQSMSSTWMHHRMGRITSSMFHRVVHCRTGHAGIVRNILQTDKPFSSEATRWGVKNEKKAVSAFIKYESTKHESFQYSKTGLRIDPTLCFLGASPDGKVICDCCDPALVEVKCPFTMKGSKIQGGKKSFLDDDLNLKPNHAFYDQIQGQMGIWGIHFCYFVVYTETDIHVQKIEFDMGYWNNIKPQLFSFFKEYVLPEIMFPK